MEEAECSSLLHDMEEAECFDPLVFFTSANVTDLEDLSSAPSLQKATTMRTANVLEIPDVQTDRNARENSPTEDATQKGSPCPSPSFLSAEADGTQSSDVPNSDADHPSDDLSLLVREDSDEPLEMLHFDDISSIMSGEDGDEPLDLSPTDDIVNGTDRDADQSGEQSQVDEMPQLNSSASTFQMLSFEAGQKDVLSSESLSESGELIDAVPSIADAGTSSSAQPLKSPPQQTDIVRMLNGEIPLKGDQEEMDLLMQLTHMPASQDLFNSVIMPKGFPPKALLPSVDEMPETGPVMAPFSFGGMGQGSKRSAPMPLLAPVPKRATRSPMHSNVEGVAQHVPKGKTESSGASKAKAEWAKIEWKKELPEETKPLNPAWAPAMMDQMQPFQLTAADASSAPLQLAKPLPAPMPSHSMQFLKSYVPPSLVTADGKKTANAYPQMPHNQVVLNSAGQYIQVAAMRPGMDMTTLLRPAPPRSMGKHFTWQSLKLLPTK
uniref:Uncharacterized protein n=1 Tax=Haptolina brevifila TaxID=156173 RepID=A0A7S2GMJ2_9EUKA